LKFYVLAGSDLADRICDRRDFRFKARPARSRKDENRHPAAGKILLGTQMAIGGDQDIELLFRLLEKLAIAVRRPAHLERGADLMLSQRMP
jgi:hypothetical protein